MFTPHLLFFHFFSSFYHLFFFGFNIYSLYLKHTELHGESPRPKRLSEQRMQGSACRTAVIFGTYDFISIYFASSIRSFTVKLPDLSAFQNKGCKDPLVEPQLFLAFITYWWCYLWTSCGIDKTGSSKT